MDKVYYYPFGFNSAIENYPELLEAFYDLQPLDLPHKRYSSHMNMCPSMKVHDNLTFVLKSPFDFNLSYDTFTRQWKSDSSEIANKLVMPSQDNKPYIQLAIFYLFWTERKSNTQLWLHDTPIYLLEEIPTWYITSGMIPIGRYTRNTSIGLVLKPNQTSISIKKQQPLCSFTFVGDKGVELIKRKPSERIIKENLKNNQKKFVCPYTYSKKLFARWLGYS